MVRISDTVNKRFKEEGEEKPIPSEVRVSPAAVKEGKTVPDGETEKLYDELISAAEGALMAGIDQGAVDITGVKGLIE